ncbi:MAG: translation initiation factor IF-2 subunit beta [Nanoarchaeota archaeon]
MQSYEELLKKAKDSLPELKLSSGRFEVPKAIGHLQGNKTIISNFTAIAKTFNRAQEHLLKYLLRELASPGNIDGPRLILGRKIPASLINEKIKQYAEEFVLCYVCKKPDTIITREDRITVIKCTACGAKHPIRSRI